MQSALWKITALAGVIGVGVLVVLQAQEGIRLPTAEPVEFTEVDSAQYSAASETADDELSMVPSTPSSQAANAFLSTFGGELPPQSEQARTATDAVADNGPEAQADAWQAPPAEATAEVAGARAPTDNPFAGLLELDAGTREPANASVSDVSTTEVSADVSNPFGGTPADPEGAEANGSVHTGLTAAPDDPALDSDTVASNDDPFVGLNALESAAETNSTASELAALPSDHPGPALMTPPRPATAVHAVAEMDAEEAAAGEILPAAGLHEDHEVAESGPHLVVPAEDVSGPDTGTPPNPFNFGETAEFSPVAELSAAPPAIQTPAAMEPRGLMPQPDFPETAQLEPEPELAEFSLDMDSSAEPSPQPSGDVGATSVSDGQLMLIAEDELLDTDTFDSAEEVTPTLAAEESFESQPTIAPELGLPDIQPRGGAQTPSAPMPWGGPTVEPAGLAPETLSSTTDALPQMEITPDRYDAGSPTLAPMIDTPRLGAETFVGNGIVADDSPSGPQQPQVSIEKTAPPQAVLGQPMVYTIVVKNVGRSPANNVLVEDRVPLGTNLTGTDPRAEYVEADGRLMWRLGRLDSGSEQTIRVRVIPTDAGQIGSVATVSFEAEVASRTMIKAPQLRFELNGPDEVRVGEQAQFRFIISNDGTAEASGVVLRSLIPQGFEHPGGDDLEYDIGLLPNGQNREVELSLLAIASGQFEKRAMLSAEGGVNIESAKPIQVLDSRIRVTRNGPENRFVGREATYVNTITNLSLEAVSGLTIEEKVPAGLQFREALPTGQFEPQQQRLLWRIPRLEAGQSLTLTSRYLAVNEGDMTSLVVATDDRGDRAELSSLTKVIGFSSLKVDVSHAGRPVAVGEEVAMRLTVRNGGTAAARQVGTWVEIPRQLRFQSAQGPVRFRERAGGIEFEPIDQLATETEQSFDIVLTAAEAGDARVRVHLASAELQEPISEEESIVIFSEDR